MSEQYYYKVCAATNGKLTSIAAFGKYRVEYAIGKVSKPVLEGSYLFVFDTPEHAKVVCMTGDQIYKCKVTGIHPEIKTQALLGDKGVEAFWRGNYDGLVYAVLDGTVLCETVELIEKA